MEMKAAVLFSLPGPSEVSFYEITFNWRPVRQERETRLATRRPPAENSSTAFKLELTPKN